MGMGGTWGLEVDKGRISLCQMRQTSQGFRLKRGAWLALPPGLISPSLTEPNVADEQALTVQLRSLQQKAGCRGGPVVVALPDLTCRLGWQDFEELTGTPAETRQLLCWRLKDRLPFSVRECRIDFQFLPSSGGSRRLLYLLAREAVITQYEKLVASIGLEPIRMITRGVALFRVHRTAASSGKRLLCAPGLSSLLVIYAEGGIPRLWRVLPWDDHGTSEDRSSRAERLLRELQETIRYLREEMEVGAMDGLLLIPTREEPLAESLTSGLKLAVHTTAKDGLPLDLLAPAGAALLQKAWRPRWISP
jgi:hypothetical protein